MSESSLLKKFLLEYSKSGSRLFRINSGMAWTGKKLGPFNTKKTVILNPGDIVIRQARPFHGAPKGTPDLVGFTTLTINEDLIGKRVAVFTSFEVKTESVRETKEQRAFIEMIKMSGGIASIVRHLNDLFVAQKVWENRGLEDEEDTIRQ